MPIAFRAVRSDSKAVSAAATQAALRKNMKIYCDVLIGKLRQDYEEIQEGPNYQRRFPRGKGGVGGGWKSKVSSDGQTGDVYNDVPYSKFVQGHIGQQSSLNRQAGWHSIDEVVIETIPFFNKQMGDSIRVGVAKARQERNRKGQFA